LTTSRAGSPNGSIASCRTFVRCRTPFGGPVSRSSTFAAPGSPDAEILPELAPVGDELVFSKTAGSVFCATNIEYVLRNLGITTLVVTGIVTTGCVHTAVTDAADRGFHVILVEDGCGALLPEMHWASIRILRDVYARVLTTEEVVARVDALAAQPAVAD
jgi:nicotinamidase-related amidase